MGMWAEVKSFFKHLLKDDQLGWRIEKLEQLKRNDDWRKKYPNLDNMISLLKKQRAMKRKESP